MSSEEQDQKKVLHGFLWNTLGQLADAANGLYLYMARFLFGGEAFGLFAIAFSFIELFNRFLIGGYGDAVTYFVSRHSHEPDLSEKEKTERVHQALAHCLLLPLVLSFLMTLLLALSSNWIYNSFWSNHSTELESVLLGLSLLLPLNVLVRIPLEAIKGLMDMRWAVWITGGLLPLTNFSFTILFYFFGWGLWSLVYGQVLAFALSLLGSLYAFSRYFSIGKTLRLLPSSLYRKDIHSFAIPQSMNMLMNFGLVRMDSLMLSLWLSANEVGIYTLLSEFTRTMRSAKTSFSKVFAPLVAKYQGMGNSQKIQESLNQIAYWTGLLSTPFVVAILLFYPEVVLGPDNDLSLSPWVVYLLCVGPLLSCYWGLAGNLLLMTGHSKVLLLNSMGLFGVNIGLNYLLIPQFGLLGAAGATAISSVAISSLQMLEMTKLEGVRFQYTITLRIIFTTFLATAFCHWVLYNSGSPFLFEGTIGAIVEKSFFGVSFLLLAFAFHAVLPGEWNLLKQWKRFQKTK